MALWVHGNYAIRIVQTLSSRALNLEGNFSVRNESDIRAPVCKRVSAFLIRRHQRPAHSLTQSAIPGTKHANAGTFPEFHFLLVCAGIITPAEPNASRIFNLKQRCGHIECLEYPGRVPCRAHNHEIVIHNASSVSTVSLGHEQIFRFLRMDEYNVHIAILPQAQCLARTDRNGVHGNSISFLEYRM